MFVLAIFLFAEIKYPDKGGLKGEKISFESQFKSVTCHCGRSWKGLVATSQVRKQRRMSKPGSFLLCLPSSTLSSPGNGPLLGWFSPVSWADHCIPQSTARIQMNQHRPSQVFLSPGDTDISSVCVCVGVCWCYTCVHVCVWLYTYMHVHAEARRQIRFPSLLPSTIFLRQGSLPYFLVWLTGIPTRTRIPRPYFPGARVPDVGQHTGLLTRVLGIKLQFSHFDKYSTLPMAPPPQPHLHADLYEEHTDCLPTYKDGWQTSHCGFNVHSLWVGTLNFFFKYLLVRCLSPFESYLLRSFICL